jgi:hypothetical protein
LTARVFITNFIWPTSFQLEHFHGFTGTTTVQPMAIKVNGITISGIIPASILVYTISLSICKLQ